MIQLQPKAPLINKLLGEQSFDKNLKYKWASFVFQVDMFTQYVFYNLFTKHTVAIEKGKEAVYIEELVKNWFLVPDGMDDSVVVKEFKQLVGNVHHMSGIIRDYTIFTTTDCNARCHYCFEKNSVKQRMETATIGQTIRFIKNHYKNQPIRIQWFGGEPLYNLKAINMISDSLNHDGITFSSSMTTNGFLFSEKLINKGVEQWHLKKVQITLDGTEHIYNQTKNYVRSCGISPFSIVLDNIEKLLNKDITVVLRLNLSLDNFDDLKELVVSLKERFGLYKNISIYPIPLFELIRNDFLRKDVYDHLFDIQSLIFKYGLGTEYAYFNRIRVNHCKADNNGHSLVIFPDGHLGLCEHEWCKRYIGHVENNCLDESEIDRWKKYNPATEKCRHCLFYADCLKLSRCDTNNFCYEEQIQFDKNQLKDTIVKHYKSRRDEIEI